jgi:D-sedoheptulose 7-phosphate isomerase
VDKPLNASTSTPSLVEMSTWYLRLASDALEVVPLTQVAALAHLILEVSRRGNAVYVFGNGGSASTADHMACDLSKNTRVDGMRHIRCVSLVSSVGLLTALANDEGYEQVFAAPLRACARPGDLALGVSGSGNSPNLVAAMQTAREMGLHSAALLGFAGGRTRDLVDLPLVVPVDSTPLVEDAHLIINHMLTEMLRNSLAHLAASRWEAAVIQ